MALIPIALAIGAISASAAPILVTFDNDADIDPTEFFDAEWVPNGFTSLDSALIHFSDTSGADLYIVNFSDATAGSNGLAVLADDDSALLIEFDFLATALSMDIGNDNPARSEEGDEAVLTLFLDGAQVGQEPLPLNLNTAMDQTITYTGTPFNSATLKFDVTRGLTETVDNVLATPIPEPRAAIVFGVGALLVGAACRRWPRAEVGPCARRH